MRTLLDPSLGSRQSPRACQVSGNSRVTRIRALLLALQVQRQRGRDVTRVVELAAATGIPLTTTSRLINEMCDSRIVDRVDDGYRLGTWLFELGECALPSRVLRDVSLPYLTDLCRSTDSITHLGIRAGGDVLYIAELAEHERYRIPGRVGRRAAANSTAIGIVLMANGGGPAPHVPSAMGRRVGGSMREADDIRRLLAAVRIRGYAIDRGATAKDLACIAVPIRVNGDVVAGVSCSFMHEDLHPERVAPALHAVADTIARRVEEVAVRSFLQ